VLQSCGLLLAVDIGNTNVAIGLFDRQTLRADWRLDTRASRTGDEYAVLLSELFRLAGHDLRAVTAASSSAASTSSSIR